MREERRCNRCNKTLSGSGRRSASGLYWCQDSKCQAARAKYNYDLQNGGSAETMAPTVCANNLCAAPLPPRKVRAGDSPLGRWCNRPACRRHRQASLAAGNIPSVGEITNLRDQIFALSRALVWGRKECGSCGRVDAIPGYMHRDYDGERCEGVGSERLTLPTAQAFWPNEVGIPEGCGPEVYTRMTEKP